MAVDNRALHVRDANCQAGPRGFVHGERDRVVDPQRVHQLEPHRVLLLRTVGGPRDAGTRIHEPREVHSPISYRTLSITTVKPSLSAYRRSAMHTRMYACIYVHICVPSVCPEMHLTVLNGTVRVTFAIDFPASRWIRDIRTELFAAFISPFFLSILEGKNSLSRPRYISEFIFGGIHH